jgi:hypothetical protein
VSASATARAAANRNLGKGMASPLAENSKIGGWGLEGARLQPRLKALFKNLRHGWEAVPLQNSNAREFFRKLFSRADKIEKNTGFSP